MTSTLILGGTAWLGREIATQLVQQGVDVTCLARGTDGPPPPGATFIAADRTLPNAYNQVTGRHWDSVIELSYDPNFVAGALDALAASASHWTLVSTVSVYSSNSEVDADESAETLLADDLTDYGRAKVHAETITRDAVGDHLLIARPGLIVGPGDPTDRFGYWVARLAAVQDGDILTPVHRDRYVQWIDVRDLAIWLINATDDGRTGTINAIGQPETYAEFLQQSALVAKHRAHTIQVDDTWLRDHAVNYWAGPRSLPYWLPAADVGFVRRNTAAYLAAGGTTRPLANTLADVLADERARGLERPRKAGLTRTEENELLAAIAPLTADSAPADARNADAVLGATGRTWDEWTTLLLHNNAAALTHPQIAQLLVAEYGVSGWWAQSITVHFEQHIGRRLPGQNNDGTFAVSASATLPIGRDALLDYFTTPNLRTLWLPAELAELNAHKPTSRSLSGRYLDTAGGRFAFFFTIKSGTKTAVSVNHSQLISEADATALRAFWKDRFRTLASTIAAATGGADALP